MRTGIEIASSAGGSHMFFRLITGSTRNSGVAVHVTLLVLSLQCLETRIYCKHESASSPGASPYSSAVRVEFWDACLAAAGRCGASRFASFPGRPALPVCPRTSRDVVD